MKNSARLSLTAATACLFALATQIAGQPALFGPPSSAPTAKMGLGKSGAPIKRDEVRRSNVVSLTDASALEQPSLLLNLFADKNYRVNREKQDETNAIKGWHGKIDGDSLSSVTIYYKDGWVSGRVGRPGELYTFDVDASGAITILDIDESKLKRELDVVQMQK